MLALRNFEFDGFFSVKGFFQCVAGEKQSFMQYGYFLLVPSISVWLIMTKDSHASCTLSNSTKPETDLSLFAGNHLTLFGAGAPLSVKIASISSSSILGTLQKWRMDVGAIILFFAALSGVSNRLFLNRDDNGIEERNLICQVNYICYKSSKKHFIPIRL